MNPRSYWPYIFAAALLLFFGFVASNEMPEVRAKDLSYSQFCVMLDEGLVRKATIDGQVVSGKLADGSFYHVVVMSPDTLVGLMVKQGVDVQVVPDQNQDWSPLSVIMFILMMALIAYLLYNYFVGGAMGGSSKMFNITKSKALFFQPGEVKTKFKDVAGLEEAKEDLVEIVDFLKHPEKYKALGAKIPRGVLLSGDPGNGKTLLAKAVAGEAHCSFFAISGSDFVELYVGVGAARVRDLFIQARKAAPCILFIDEIDAIGKQRGNGFSSGGSDERDQTLNQLLAELDGFATDPGSVIVVAATNRPEVLDSALVRPGRIDKKVIVPYPDIKSRLALLAIHSRKVPLAEDVNFEMIARGTPGMSGAQLESLINEAALQAARHSKKTVDMEDFEEARDRLSVGAARKSMVISDKIKKETAIHEAGHALLNILLEDARLFHKVTILPRGNALGISWSFVSADEELAQSSRQMIAEIKVCFGGMIAEQMKLNTTTSGVSSDLVQATQIARQMAILYGMSSAGAMSLAVDFGNLSQATKSKLDAAVEEILKKAHLEAEELLKRNEHLLDKLADELYQQETLQASQVYELLGIAPREETSFLKNKRYEQPATSVERVVEVEAQKE